MNSCVFRLPLTWMPNNAESICRKVSKNLRWPSLHAFIIHCGTKLVRIAPPNTYTHILGFCRQPNCISIQWLRHPNPNDIFLHYRSTTCLNTLVGGVDYLSTLLKYTLFQYVAELYPILTHCWGIPYLITLLSNSQFTIHCWAIPKPNTLLRYSPSYYTAEQIPISIQCWAIPNPKTFLK